MEYFSGILILTTNRVGQFDESVFSRIHVFLGYELLDKAYTLRIWDIQLRNFEELSISRQDEKPLKVDRDGILRFAENQFEKGSSERWNGRQIKNAIATAVAIAKSSTEDHEWASAEYDKGTVVLTAAHFKAVLGLSQDFNSYIRATAQYSLGDSSALQDQNFAYEPAAALPKAKTRKRASTVESSTDGSVSSDIEEEDLDIQELQLKLKMAKLKKKRNKLKANRSLPRVER